MILYQKLSCLILGISFNCFLTLTFSVYKVGQFLAPGHHRCGKIVLLDINLPRSSFEKTITTLLRYRGFDCNDNGLTRTFAADYNGGRYDGDWYMAKPSGRGRMQFASGNIFTGEFEAGRIVGTGKMTYVDSGSYYEGQWQADKPRML